MTISDVITFINEVQPNAYSDAVKIRWINHLMGQLAAEVWLCDSSDMAAYGTADTTCALPNMPSGYSGIWEKYIRAEIHRANEEDNLAATAYADFNDILGAYTRWYARKMEPAYRDTRQVIRFKLDGISASGTIFRLPPRCLLTGAEINILGTTTGAISLYAGNTGNKIGSTVDMSVFGSSALAGAFITGADGADIGITVTAPVNRANLDVAIYYADGVLTEDVLNAQRGDLEEVEAALIEFGRRAFDES